VSNALTSRCRRLARTLTALVGTWLWVAGTFHALFLNGDDHGPDTESERCGVMDMPHAPSHAPPRSMHTHLTRPAPPARLTFFLARHRARGDFGGQRRRYLDTHDRCAATSRHKSFTDRFTAHTYTTHRSLVKTSRWLTLHTLYKPARASSDTSQLRYEPAQRRASSETRQLRYEPAQIRARAEITRNTEEKTSSAAGLT